jgi:hypothetical protein
VPAATITGLQADDRAYLVRLVAARTGLSAAEAERRVEDVSARGRINQVKVNLGTGATGETRSAAAQEIEARAARTDVESRAAVGLSMEAIVERDNLRKHWPE